MRVKINRTWLKHDGFVKVEQANLQFEMFNGKTLIGLLLLERKLRKGEGKRMDPEF
jgi:hypothetical protein